MSRINTNVSSLIAQRVLKRNNSDLNTSLERLSTGLSINSGKDNPAGLIASENLRSEKAGITQAIDNAGRASNIIGTAEGGLSEVSNLLVELQSLVSQAARGDEQGRVQGAASAVESLGRTIGPVWGNTTLQHFGESTPYVSAAALLIVTLLISAGSQVADSDPIGAELLRPQ